MIGNPRFWIALILYFASAGLTAGVRVHTGKKEPLLGDIFLVLALICSIGLWVFAGSISFKSGELLNYVNLICIAGGVLTGRIVFLFPFIIALPLLFSIGTGVPLAPLVPETESTLGELYFYPSNEGDVKAGWINGDSEILISLKGDKAGILFMRKSLPAQYFFLKESIKPVAVLSESHPVSDLSLADPTWYFPLSGDAGEASLYSNSFPAVKYHDTGFFTSYLYTVQNGQILIRKN